MLALEAENIIKTFQEGRVVVPVLRGISLALEPGEIVALEGPSGSGKTTLLSILGCILTPTSGRVEIDGTPVDYDRPHRLPEIRKRSVGFIFQQYNLFPALTARDNVAYALNLKGVVGREAYRMADTLLDIVGMSDRTRFYPRDLSGGQKQRIAVARALAGRPRVLLADEPTANLDSEMGSLILELFERLAREHNCAILIVTHDPRVRACCNRVLHIRDGSLTSEDFPNPPSHDEFPMATARLE
jgi:putative ABC transport system ATP-binding protein